MRLKQAAVVAFILYKTCFSENKITKRKCVLKQRLSIKKTHRTSQQLRQTGYIHSIIS